MLALEISLNTLTKTFIITQNQGSDSINIFSNFIFFLVTVPIFFQLSLPKISDILLLSSSLNENNIFVGSSPKRAPPQRIWDRHIYFCT
ncbi:MAG: hypothetical protein Ct9H90mP2_07470 [Dehalococcoidia bacterium]|nr:MAG: hypothetical protein Ct9H90mP2_07470 [Dehalococcoidia bacterium]